MACSVTGVVVSLPASSVTVAVTDRSIVVAMVSPDRFCTTPKPMSTTAATREMGSRTRSPPRTRSTQKLPRVRPRRRRMPRMMATAIAMPAAAETKFCTARATIWDRWLMAPSPEYHCQLVLVMKLTAAFQAPYSGTPGRSVGLTGREPWTRSTR